MQLCYSRFVPDYDPTIEDTYRKQVTIDETTVLAEMFDTANE